MTDSHRPSVPATARGFDRAVADFDRARPSYPRRTPTRPADDLDLRDDVTA